MAIVVDNPNLFGVVHFGGFTAQSASSSGVTDFGPQLYAVFPLPVPLHNPLDNITQNIRPGFNTYYKMQGYNPITQEYEFWHCQGTPLMNPPSGHTLENVSIVTSWKDR